MRWKKLRKRTIPFMKRVHVIDPCDAAEALADAAAATNLQRIDEADAVPRPSDIETYYVEDVYDAWAAEQPHLWAAAGKAASRDPAADAAALEKTASDIDQLSQSQLEIVEDTAERKRFAGRVFRFHTRRAKGDKARYYVTMAGLLGGDIAGVTGAAILLGEPVSLAVIQAVASGTAAITSGLIGLDAKDLVRSRWRAKPQGELTEDEKLVTHHFSGARGGEVIIKLAGGSAFVLWLLIGGSIASLRLSTEGTTAAFAFGCLAVGISIASFLNAFAYADEIADLLDAVNNDHRREVERMLQVSQHKTRSAHAEAKELAESIVEEFGRLGSAAAEAARSAKASALVANPGVAGHGRSADPWRQSDDGRGTSGQKVVRETVEGAAPGPVPDLPEATDHGSEGTT